MGLRRRSSVAPFPFDGRGSKARQDKARRREAQVIQILGGEKGVGTLEETCMEDDEDGQDGATLQRARLNLATIDYEGWFPRIVHVSYPFH